jgi:hypothetical protein
MQNFNVLQCSTQYIKFQTLIKSGELGAEPDFDFVLECVIS